MRSSWKKLRDFAQQRSKDKIVSSYAEPTESLDEFAKRMQKVQDMRKFYEGFHKMSSNVAVRAHGFSEAIQDMGKYLTNSCSPMGDGNVGNFLTMVGKVQLEVARFFDLYAAHVSSTLTISTENTLHEIQVAEETKLKYDERRRFFDHLRVRQTKGRLKNQKSELHVEKQLQTTKHQFDELALSLDFRVLSLEQRRFHNVITKVSQHHTAQMHAFRKAFASINKIEPYIDLMAKQRKIDRQIHIDDHNIDSDSDSDLIGNLPATPDEHDDSINSSSSEQIPILETIIDDDPSAARRSTYAGSKSVPLSPVRLPEGDASETFQNLLIESSLQSIRAFQRGSTQMSSILEGEQKALHSSSTLGTSTSPLTVKNLRLGQHDKLHTSYIDHPQDLVMLKGLVAEEPLKEMPTNAQLGNSALKRSDISFSERNLQSFPAQLSASVSTLPPLMAQKQWASPKFTNPNFSQVVHKHGSGPAPMLNKRYTQSGPLTPMGNPWSVKIGTPSPYELPPLPDVPVHAQEFYKSGPFGWSAGVRPFSSPSISPYLSPPRVSELHKLPLPPSDSKNSSKQSIIPQSGIPTEASQGPSAYSSISAAPLPRPPVKDDRQTLPLSSSPQRRRSAQHLQ